MKKFRVEAFIIPTNNCASICKEDVNNSETNEIDDVKLANKLKEQSFSSMEETNSDSDNKSEGKLSGQLENLKHISEKEDCNESYEFSGEFFEINEHIYDEIITPKKNLSQSINLEAKNDNNIYTKAILKVEDPIYDEPYVGNFTSNKVIMNENATYDVPQPHWTLVQSKYRRFGIVAPKLPKRSSSLHSIIEDAEQIDESLDQVCCERHRYKNKEISQGPEDVSEGIFKENWMQKLSALRSLEILLRDKEIALQSRERLLFKKEKELRILERLVKDKMRQAELYAKRCKKAMSSDSIFYEEYYRESVNNGFKSHTNCKPEASEESNKLINNKINPRNPLNADKIRDRGGSVRCKAPLKNKNSPDDLDSTLSADIGDTSLAITAKKFDPKNFKKPLAFARTAFERRSMLNLQNSKSNATNVNENIECANYLLDPRQEKIFKRFTENILACKNEETKFQNYGLIDEKNIQKPSKLSKEDITTENRFSYLNLESLSKTLKFKNNTKERPHSWNEESDSWLQKKREAYNTATRTMSTVHVASEKENCSRFVKVNQSMKIGKEAKKFSIFR